MTMTIKQLADALEVSKTAVRKYLTDEFRANHTETNRNGVITIDPDGCKLIAVQLGREEKLAEPSANQTPETSESAANGENLVIPRVVWDALQEQLREKDRQLAAKDLQITDMTATIRAQSDSIQAAQALHAGTMQQQLLPDAAEPAQVVAVDPDSSEPAPAPKFWNRLKDFFR